MYNPQSAADRLKKLLTDRQVTGKQMASDLGLGVNTLSNIRRGDVKSVETFIVIADYLGCSTDYLLGRTDTPTGTYSISNSQTTINGTQANVIHNAMGSDGLTDEFMKVFAKLCFDDKVSVMQYVKDIKKSPSDDGNK